MINRIEIDFALPVELTIDEMRAEAADEENEMTNDSALHWLPRITALGLPVPRTHVIALDYQKMYPIFDGQPCSAFTKLIADVQDYCAKRGTPLFVRTDLSSAKHSGPKGYLLDGKNNVGQVLFNLLEDSEMKMFMGPQPQALLLREFLELEHKFTAFHGLPIAREWRLFAGAETCHCAHQYWPLEAIGETLPNAPRAWVRRKLQEYSEWLPEMDVLKDMAVQAARACAEGTPVASWSVDFARDVSGKWWLIDISTARHSWHPECPKRAEVGGTE